MVITQQLEMNFLWPLNEQIELDLDYTNCERNVPA
jgi:hypothetical protein